MTKQLDMFAQPKRVPLKDEALFGKMDAICGFPLSNRYSRQLTGDRLTAYEQAWREARDGSRRAT